MVFPHKGNIYLIPYINYDFNDLSEISSNFQFYGYWTNVDPDSDCSKEEWEERERIWNEIFDGPDPVSFYGLNYEMMNEFHVNGMVIDILYNRKKETDNKGDK